jgi:PAS domain S-box-containing protein
MSTSRSADERYRALLEHPTSIIIVLEAVWTGDGAIADLRYVDSNANHLRLLDTNHERLLGTCVREVAPDHSEHFIERCARVMQSGVPCSYETSFRGADFHVWLCRSALNEVVVCATDITSRTRAEGDVHRLLQALNAEKEWLFAALNSINEEVYFADPQGRYLYANPVALREFGHASVQGMPVASIVSPLVVLRADGSPRPVDEAPPLRALNGEVIVGEEQIVHNPRTGEWRHRQVSSAPVRDAGGGVIGSVSVVRDVTDSKRAEARLRDAVDAARAGEKASRDALTAELSAMQRLHDLSTTAISTSDQQTLLEEILDATMALHAADFGSVRLFDTQAQVLRIAAHRGFPPWFLGRFAAVDCRDTTIWGAALWGRARDRRERVIIEDVETHPAFGSLFNLARQVGTRTMQATPLFTADGCPLGMLTTHFVRPRVFSESELRLTDLYARQAGMAIERKRAEADLIAAREAADQANKAKSHFVRAASHDLRQSVQTLAMLNRSLRAGDMDASARSIVGQQDDAIDTMARLLDALLNISRLESGVVGPEMTDFLVMPLFAKLRTEFSRLAIGKGLVLNVDVAGQPVVRSDPTLVGEILRNLLSNAIKFTRRGKVELRCQPAGDAVRLEVVDTGIGIPRDEQGRIFDEFYQVGVSANVRREGYGLGLGIVQRMATLLGARVDVDSEPGRGSRFSIVVPAGEAATNPSGGRITTGAARPVAAVRSTILLVEDDPSVRVSIERFFRVEGYRLVGAESLDQALSVLGESARPELLITDYHLPGGKTGLDVIDAVRTVLGPGFPAIMLSGDTSSDVAVSPDDQRLRFASKPVDPDRLVCLVQELLTPPPL